MLFYPKLHCEPNYTEFFCGAVMHYTRENCNFSFVDLERKVEAALTRFPSVQSGILPIG